jgi:salicylate hydroxylase
MDMDVVIVGGGLGGLALAVGLRERGIKAQVYERAAENRHNTGTAISIGHNGVYTLSPSPPPNRHKEPCTVEGP